MTRVTVERINIPAMSTIGYGYGRDEDGNAISFIGDHRPMRNIGEALQQAAVAGADQPVADVPDDLILAIEEPS